MYVCNGIEYARIMEQCLYFCSIYVTFSSRYKCSIKLLNQQFFQQTTDYITIRLSFQQPTLVEKISLSLLCSKYLLISVRYIFTQQDRKEVHFEWAHWTIIEKEVHFKSKETLTYICHCFTELRWLIVVGPN